MAAKLGLVLTPEQPATPSQRARQERIVAAAVELAGEGGYDAVQMREVAERSGVALGTLYRYFPSKKHLLVAAMGQELARMRDAVMVQGRGAEAARERLLRVISGVTEALGRNRRLSAAMVYAFMGADESVSSDVDRVGTIMIEIISWATHGAETPPTANDAHIAGIIGKVWLFDIAALVADRMTINDVKQDLAMTIATVIPDGVGLIAQAPRTAREA